MTSSIMRAGQTAADHRHQPGDRLAVFEPQRLLGLADDFAIRLGGHGHEMFAVVGELS